MCPCLLLVCCDDNEKIAFCAGVRIPVGTEHTTRRTAIIYTLNVLI